VFWHLAEDRIVAAMIARAEREPVLEACAASYGRPISGSCFAPGVIEVSWVLGADREAHVAALAAPFCRIDAAAAQAAFGEAAHAAFDPPEADGPAGAAEDAGERLATVRGAASGFKVRAHEGAVAQAAAMFRRARLRLVALDCEPCAIATLAEALGTGDPGGARRQHLSAVTVMPDCEAAAEALGEDLAVPVGLAISWFGAGRAR
jgi:hypothetical protein